MRPKSSKPPIRVRYSLEHRCRCSRPLPEGELLCETCKLGMRRYYKNNKYARMYERQKIKSEVINRYGGRCVCCGETWLPFLQIDHINGDGAIHRKSMKGSLYQWLIRNHFPEGFQVLCANCNFAKGNANYVCVHRMSPEDQLHTRDNFLAHFELYRATPTDLFIRDIAQSVTPQELEERENSQGVDFRESDSPYFQ